MKTKWIVEYWDHTVDCLKKIGFHTHEDAITHANKVKNKWGSNNIKIKLRGSDK